MRTPPKQAVSIIGAPTDIGASRIGARMGPEALRVAGIAQAIAHFGAQVQDCGDVSGPRNPQQGPVEGFRHLREVAAWSQAVHDRVYRELTRGRLPLLLGGDHSLAIGSVSAVAAYCHEQGKKLRILWLDAHADFNTSQITPSGNIHGMPVACLLGHGPAALTQLSPKVRAIAPADIRLIGVRSVDEPEKRFLREQGMAVLDMRYIDEFGMRHTMAQALADIDTSTHLHVSFDIDFLDPDMAPGTGSTVRGGPSYREAQLCMEMMADVGQLGSLDIVELNPALDHRNSTAELAVDLVESLFGKSTLLRR
jgi:arginase